MRVPGPTETPPPVLCEPPLERWPDAGVYQLWLRVSVAVRVRIGRLGRFAFHPGLYVYTGRATRGLRARVRRHVVGGRKRHWHIDYLLARREVSIERVELVARDPAAECTINSRMGSHGCAAAPGFGASDCPHRCRAHLWLIAGG